MSWEDIMRRVLPPIGGVSPHITSRYGEEEGGRRVQRNRIALLISTTLVGDLRNST